MGDDMGRFGRVECRSSDIIFLPLRACTPMLFKYLKTSSIDHVKHKYNDSLVWYDRFTQSQRHIFTWKTCVQLRMGNALVLG